jgi:aspartate carbamoyltransferase catalytic subunit
MLSIIETAVDLKAMVNPKPVLAGKTICTLFYEASTRTRISFEQAARKLGASVVSVAASSSSISKGESLKDTVCTLKAEGIDAIVLRHPSSGAPKFASTYFNGPILNAGDGCHEHPTQALLDLLTIKENKGRIEGLTVALVGDILHSRVARSNIWGLSKLGATVRLVAPPTLMPPEAESLPVETYHDLSDGLHGADVVMTLRMQTERMHQGLIPSIAEYARLFQINELSLDYTLSEALWGQVAPNCLVMHPGPMNRGVEISDDAADGPNSVILAQVANGIPIRMAALMYAFGEASNAITAS